MSSPDSSDETLFAAALQRETSAKRAAYLDEACAGKPDLRRRVEELLRASDDAPTFLERPVGQPRKPAADAPAPATIKIGFTDLGPAEEGPGTRIGRYKVLQQIGEGGCGTVFMAEQEEPVRRRVALKVIKLGMDTKSVVARFEAERQALAMMDHPNIAKVLDAGATESGRPFFVMELVRGIPITRYCDENHLSTVDRLKLFIKVCQAIQHAHQKGIIHRDIKPSNILVTLHDGVPVPKVIDFGIAKATEQKLTDKTLFTAFEQFIGTPAYMSPEQAEMSGLDIDTRADIYALGVLLYELLAGSTPFDAKTLMASGIDAMRKTIREQEPQRPSTRLTLELGRLGTTAPGSAGIPAGGGRGEAGRMPALPGRASGPPPEDQKRAQQLRQDIALLRGDLDWIVMKCLEKDRTRRYETANGLAADLTRHLTNEPVQARPPSQWYRFQKAYRRNRISFTAAACVLVSLVIALAFIWVAAKRAGLARVHESIQRNLAEQQRNKAEAAQKRAETEQQRADAQSQKATESQQQSRRLLYAADMNLAQQSLKQNNLGRARRLLERHRPQPGEEDLRGWEWRYLWQLTRSSALVTVTNRPVRGWDLSFSPDGSRLAVGWEDGQVDLWDVLGRRLLRNLAGRGKLGAAHVAFSPVRNLLAATSEIGGVTLYDLDSGRESVFRRTSKPDWDSVRDISFSPDGSKLVIFATTLGSTNSLAEVCVADVSSSVIETRHSAPFDSAVFFGAARLSPDNRRLYLARSHEEGNRYSIQCLDLSDGRQVWQTETQPGLGVSALALSSDGKLLVSGSGYEDSTIRVWDVATGRLLRQVDGHSGWVTMMLFSKDGRQLVSSATDQTIRFWDTGTWSETKVLRGHNDEVNGVAIADSAQLVASASKDGDLMLWRADAKSATGGYRLLPEEFQGDIAPVGQAHVMFPAQNYELKLFDLKSDRPPITLHEIAFSTNVVTSWLGTNLIQWNGTNQILVRELRGTEFIQRGAVTLDTGKTPVSLAYRAARQLVAWTEAASTNSVYLMSLVAPGRRIELKSDVAVLGLRNFNQDGHYLEAILGVQTETWTESASSWCVWDIDSGRVVASDQGYGFGTFATNGRVFVVSNMKGQNHETVFYDLSHPELAPRRVPGRDAFHALDVSPDGGLVASANEAGQVELFDPAKGELIEILHGHLNAAFGVAFSPDGRRLISSALGREAVKLWDVATHQELLTLAGTGSNLGLARWSADGDVILVGLPSQAWRAPSWEEIAAAEAKEKAELKQP